MNRLNRFSQIALLATLVNCILGCPCERVGGSGDPSIEFTFVPRLSTFQNLRGRVSHVEPCNYAVAVYIFAGGGWYNKPTWEAARTVIRSDGSWTADITTGGVDETASKIAAFLVPADYGPPLLSGPPSLPVSLLETAVAHTAVERSTQGTTRLLFFSGYEWWVKASDTPVGPGPNPFSDSRDNVWLDSQGQLHLKITEESGVYKTAEVVSKDSFGYGSYIFHLTSPVSQLDPNVVLGLFLWSDDPDFNHREIDIEFSRWQDPLNQNAQFVVQPWDTPGNMERFDMGPDGVSTHAFTWLPDEIRFQSALGSDFPSENQEDITHEWLYTGEDIPVSGSENVRMNLWLVWGIPPTDGSETEIVISRFEFMKASK